MAGFIFFTSADGLSTSPEQWVTFTPTGKHKDIFACDLTSTKEN